MMTVFLDILFRWIHVSTACVLLGSSFFMRVIFPLGTRSLEPAARQAAFLQTRRVFKMVIHTGILLLLISGAYNAVRNWRNYTLRPPLLHGLFGLHLFLAIAIFAILLMVLAGREPPAWHRTGAAVAVVLLFLAVAAASTLKWGRERAVVRHAGLPAPLIVSPQAPGGSEGRGQTNE